MFPEKFPVGTGNQCYPQLVESYGRAVGLVEREGKTEEESACHVEVEPG